MLVIHPLTSCFSFRTAWLVLHSHDNMKIKSRDANLWCSASIGWKKAGTKQTHFKSSFFFFYCKSARANRQSMQIILVFKQIKHSMQQQQKKKKERKTKAREEGECRRQCTTGKCDEWAHVNEWNLYTAMWYVCSSTFWFLFASRRMLEGPSWYFYGTRHYCSNDRQLKQQQQQPQQFSTARLASLATTTKQTKFQVWEALAIKACVGRC